MKSWRMRWERHVLCMAMINTYNILVGKPERRPLEDLDVDGRMNLD
jgi:hypothetical protein